MRGDTMNQIIEVILSMIISFGLIGFCTWIILSIQEWGEE